MMTEDTDPAATVARSRVRPLGREAWILVYVPILALIALAYFVLSGQ
jgi:hypothetical protein